MLIGSGLSSCSMNSAKLSNACNISGGIDDEVRAVSREWIFCLEDVVSRSHCCRKEREEKRKGGILGEGGEKKKKPHTIWSWYWSCISVQHDTKLLLNRSLAKVVSICLGGAHCLVHFFWQADSKYNKPALHWGRLEERVMEIEWVTQSKLVESNSPNLLLSNCVTLQMPSWVSVHSS